MPHVTVPASPAIHQYTVSAAPQTSFAVTFPFFQLSGLRVLTLSAAGVLTELQYASAPSSAAQFSVSGTQVDGGYSSGTVTIGGEGVANVLVTVRRNIPAERTSDLPYPSGFVDVGTINTEFDVLTARINDMARSVQQAVRVSDGASVTTSGLELPTPIARRAIIFNTAATGLTLTTHDPDASHDLVAGAAADAAAAEAAAVAAAASAAQALIAVSQTGQGSFKQWGPITLVAGQADYLLPEQPSGPDKVGVFYGSVWQPYDATDPRWSITDTIAAGRTLHLNITPTLDGSSQTAYKAGDTISGWLVGALVGDALGVGAITSREIGDGAIARAAQVADGILPAAKIASGADLSGFIPSLVAAKVNTTAITDGSLLIDASNTIAGVAPSTNGSVATCIGGVWVAQQHAYQMGEQPLTGQQVVTWSIPTAMRPMVNEISFEIYKPGVSGSDSIILQLRTGASTWATDSYETLFYALNENGADFQAFDSNVGFIIYRTSLPTSRQFVTTSCSLRKTVTDSGDFWSWGLEGHTRLSSTQQMVSCSGRRALSGTITGVRILTSGSNTFTGGLVSALARI